MRFCQSDGTPLVEDAMPVDPYKTMVASKEEIAAAMPKPTAPPVPEPKADEVLDLPADPDPLKTMYASEDEIRREMEKNSPPAENVIDLPPLAPETPKSKEPTLSPPPSPFATPKIASEPAGSPFGQTTPPIPSPFETPKPIAVDPPKPNLPAFAEPEPIVAETASNPFDQSSAPAAWTPPAAPEASWQNQEIGKETPFQPPASGTGKLNQTLPIVSLVLGIVSLCCYVSPITGLGALVTGFLGMKNIKSDPNQFGGKTLALVGMILGGLFFLVGVLYWVFVLFFGGMAMMMDATR